MKKAVVVGLVLMLALSVSVVPAAAAPDPGCDYNGDGKGDLAFGWSQAGGSVGLVPASAAPDPGCDYNGDGKGDLAFAWSLLDEATGVVGVLYGSSTGLGNFEEWRRDTAGIKGTSGELFGAALTCGDFDGDGRDDLAIGSGDSDTSYGVNIIYGSAAGLTASGDQLWSQDTDGIKGTSGDDGFGTSLTAGDFDGDGYTDLAIGAPFDDDVRVNGGEVHVFYGSTVGLTANDQLWTQDSPDVKGTLVEGDFFGWAMTTGDFDDDGYTDLAIGAWNDFVNGILGAGSVNVLYGGPGGLSGSGDQWWHQDSPGIKGTVQAEFESFGYALSSGDFDGDGVRDLAIGEVHSRLDSEPNVGAVHILFGQPGSGLTEAGDELWNQDSPDVKGVAGAGDHFGHSLAAGDYNGDGKTDLAVGVLSFSDGTGGGVQILDGTSSGLSGIGDQLVSQATDGIKGVPADTDDIATSMRSGDFDGDGKRDLAFGNCVDDDSYGSLQILYGASGGLSTTDQFFESSDFFVFGDDGGGFGDVGGRDRCR